MALEIAARNVVKIIDEIPNNIPENGEQWLLERTSEFGFETLFDVGANIGTWTTIAVKNHPEATIHAFEILPKTYEILCKNTQSFGDKVVCNDFGLADENGEIQVYLGDSLYISSTIDFSMGNNDNVSTCVIRRGDDYTAKKGISKIDFLKIDVEGSESKVLNGILPLLDSRQIKLVQFEYNRGAIMSGFLLRNFYEFFESRGYRVGKLTPDGVIFRDYDFAFEDFIGPNYVACLDTELHLQKKISVN